MKKALSIALAALFLSLTACSVSYEKSDSEVSGEAIRTESLDTKSAANTECMSNRHY